MLRIFAIALGVASVAASANAADIAVQTAGKSPSEVRAAITEAAYKVCARAYWDDTLSVYKRDTCVQDTIEAAMAQARSIETAMNTHAEDLRAAR